MTFLYLLFACGIVLVGYLPELPSQHCVFIVLTIVLLFAFLRKKIPVLLWLLAFSLGISYGIFSGYQFLDDQLPDDLVAQDILVEGRVVGLPQLDSRRQLFSLQVVQAYKASDSAQQIKKFPQKITISSYDALRVKTGEQWRLVVKLKKPRGFVNPSGFDYQASLLRKGIGATGYIRPSVHNQLLEPQPKFSMDVLRYDLQQWLLQKSDSTEKSILVALLVGDTSLVDKDQWGEMIKTGTNHLIAISGLHLGFFAIVGFIIGNFIGRFIQLLWHKFPAMIMGYFFAISCTVFYSILAGLNIPTLRTLIMLGVVQFVYLWRRSFRGRDTLLLALVLVLLYDPLAAYDMGFWLSFCAVGLLIFCFSERIAISDKRWAKIPSGKYFFEFIKSQWVMFIGLLIPLAVLVHTSSLLAPPANFVAIPLVTFFVVPCLILSAICHFVFPYAEGFFLHGAEWGLSLLHEWLKFLLVSGAGKFNPSITFNAWTVLLAALSVFLLLIPRGLGNRALGFCGLSLALIIPLKQLPPLQLLVFDVGQGTAVLIRTARHQLLYDTGPLYTENFDAGSGIIVPYLQSQGLRRLDAVVVSHNDLDHSGGLAGVLAATQVEHLLLGEPEKYHSTSVDQQINYCHEYSDWQWDDVSFHFISWPIIATAKANNHSCVLLVEYRGHKILLTGDIEKEVEQTLLANGSVTGVEILLAPHHGSHTSSTQEFVTQTHPVYVIYSAGYHNQHGHPHKDVEERYSAVNAVPLNTAFSGAIEFLWDTEGLQNVNQYRQIAPRYWFAKN